MKPKWKCIALEADEAVGWGYRVRATFKNQTTLRDTLIWESDQWEGPMPELGQIWYFDVMQIALQGPDS